MDCQRCGGLIVTQDEVFDPPHDVCSHCGREPGVELVTRMEGAEYDVKLVGDYRHCLGCHRKVSRDARRCVCGARVPLVVAERLEGRRERREG